MLKSISIFDMDDTILEVPTFPYFVDLSNDNIVDTSKRHADYFAKIKGYFSILFSKELYFVKSGDYIVVYDSKTKQPISTDYVNYIQDLDPDTMPTYGLKRGIVKEMMRMFEVKDNKLILRTYPGFHSDPNTLGNKVNDAVIDDYKKATNKMIISGRDEALRPQIEQRIKELNLEYPNYGIFLYDENSGISNFKNETIASSIEKNDWEEVHFYEDRKDWLDSAGEYVKEKFPDVKFYKHHISNIKKSHKF